MGNEVMDMNIDKIEEKLARLGYDDEAIQKFSEEQKYELIQMMGEELDNTADGVDLKPVKVKINKDMAKFADPFDKVLDTLKGVIVYKHQARGYWPENSNDKVPECSSMDGIIGTNTETGEEINCASCQYNEWGSAESGENEEARGKACKEMRRIYLDLEEYELPVMLTLPPTSIKEFDNYISARLTKGIPDIFRETIIELEKTESHGYSYSVAKFKIGDNVSPERIMELKEKRKKIKEAAVQEDITHEDYIDDEPVTNVNSDTDLDDVDVTDVA